MNGGTSASGRSFITISGRTCAKKCLIVSTSLEGKNKCSIEQRRVITTMKLKKALKKFPEDWKKCCQKLHTKNIQVMYKDVL